MTANSQSELAFIKKYQVDDSVAEILDKHADEIVSQLKKTGFIEAALQSMRRGTFLGFSQDTLSNTI